MKKWFIVTLMLIASSAHALEIKEFGTFKRVTFHSDYETFVAMELYNSISEVLTDPLEQKRQEYIGKNYRIASYSENDDEMELTFKAEFLIDPVAQKLKITQVGKRQQVTFEGDLASLILKGLLLRRPYNEANYEYTRGEYYGDFTIETAGIKCKYAHRNLPDSHLVEKFAECSLTTL